MLNRTAVWPLVVVVDPTYLFLAKTKRSRTGNVNLPQIGQLAAFVAAPAA